jgi:DNA (cytosine-5)-methyltransferase 1
LWPAFHALIAECIPATVFGEQVASTDGREWLAGVRADLEGLGYAVGAADLCAAGVGAPHIRQRLFWVGYADQSRCEESKERRECCKEGQSMLAAGRGNFWSGSRWHQCLDGKAKRVPLEPALFPLAPRLPGRVGLLRGAGNSIVPQVAAEFVKAFML